jgi:S-formylglutathione hydrolase FrmB
MKGMLGTMLVLLASLSWAAPNEFRPAPTNVWGAQYPRIDERGRVQVRVMHEGLTAANIRHVYVESPGTDHEWQTWRRALKDFAPRLFQDRKPRT